MNAKLIYQHKQDIPIEIDGPTLADLFWDMDAEEQARFFNRMGHYQKLPMQLQHVTDHEKLAGAGRAAMKRIGEYS